MRVLAEPVPPAAPPAVPRRGTAERAAGLHLRLRFCRVGRGNLQSGPQRWRTAHAPARPARPRPAPDSPLHCGG
ncbi:hypothetical protein SLNWT_1973 [Streptomyces albus]|uniref:Uncharacterized protein n=1 Tax=Streptomyces albus (strain ATCC 21838 / DSM 41398 / FERM P-419 / JCM 4703 / NBRC 107858) TaxID=1081613 RepID=A0A0B5ELG6_STRA4|nr:hypothetical protein SLNWT_1973 [Streptomyces albus]AOU76665.1 hypothetical protein SLNHY_1974 [Streptomyces albus]AYN32446.1 hypothetical protein DUI70_1943 [Streptomyces albus]